MRFQQNRFAPHRTTSAESEQTVAQLKEKSKIHLHTCTGSPDRSRPVTRVREDSAGEGVYCWGYQTYLNGLSLLSGRLPLREPSFQVGRYRHWYLRRRQDAGVPLIPPLQVG